jgi:hypothetical protein
VPSRALESVRRPFVTRNAELLVVFRKRKAAGMIGGAGRGERGAPTAVATEVWPVGAGAGLIRQG